MARYTGVNAWMWICNDCGEDQLDKVPVSGKIIQDGSGSFLCEPCQRTKYARSRFERETWS